LGAVGEGTTAPLLHVDGEWAVMRAWLEQLAARIIAGGLANENEARSLAHVGHDHLPDLLHQADRIRSHIFLFTQPSRGFWVMILSRSAMALPCGFTGRHTSLCRLGGYSRHLP
jgi:hypothetical protein